MVTTAVGTTPVQLGQAIRDVREQRGLSLRELARRVNVSPSFVSQIELGKANPSVGTLYALLSELGTSLDELIGGQQGGPGPEQVGVPPVDGHLPDAWPRVDVPVQSARGRQRVEMSGVVWERLTHDHDPFVDFLHVEYAPGSSSCAPDRLMRHGGREYGHLLRGRLDVQVGFETHALGPGDSISFDSMEPHRFWTIGDEPSKSIWTVVKRRYDPRVDDERFR